MARTRIANEQPIKSWEDVDLTLKEMAECELEIERITTKMNESIHDVKLEAKTLAEPHEARLKEMGLQVKDYVEENRHELKGKTKLLTFGKVGFRLSTKVVIKKVASTVESLKQFGMTKCINVKETIDKDILKSFDEEDIRKVGASLKTEDVFWYETDRESLLN